MIFDLLAQQLKSKHNQRYYMLKYNEDRLKVKGINIFLNQLSMYLMYILIKLQIAILRETKIIHVRNYLFVIQQ